MGSCTRLRARAKKKALPDSLKVTGEEDVAAFAPTSEAPANLPVMPEEVMEDEIDALKALETHAHVHATLISSDALRLIANHGTRTEQMELLDKVIARAKTTYPSENEWTVLNKERVITLLA